MKSSIRQTVVVGAVWALGAVAGAQDLTMRDTSEGSTSTSPARAQQEPAAELIPGATAVRPSWVSGRTLRVADLNFSVDAPGDKWQWLQVALPSAPLKMAAFVCVDAASDTSVMLSAFPKDPRGNETSTFLNGFISGIKKQLAARQWTVKRHSLQPSELPLAGSTRFVIEATQPDGSPVDVHGYLVLSDRAYALQQFVASGGIPQELEDVAKTFRLIQTPKPYSPPSAGVVYFGILGLIWGAAALLNLIIRRAVVNGALVAGALILLAAGTLIVRTAGSLDGETLGRRVGEAFIPLAIAAWGAQRFCKKHGWAELTASR